MYNMLNILADGEGAGTSFTRLLTGLYNMISNWAAIGVMVLGIIMVVVAIWKGFKGAVSDKAQTNWAQVIIVFFVGALLAFGGGWVWIGKTSAFGSNTLDEIDAAGQGGLAGAQGVDGGKPADLGKTGQ
jgi:hypothetical protein